MDIAQNISEIKKNLPNNVKLVAVSKTKSEQDIMVAYQSGHKIFGENKVQELCRKQEDLPKDIEWHFIGHLQTNKVKFISSFVHLLHGIDSLKLLRVVNKEAAKNNRIINCLLQFHIAEEESKFGLSLEEARKILDSNEFNSFQNVNIRGIMGMATFTNDEKQLTNEFRMLKNTFNTLKNEYFSNSADFIEISMGMSDDYAIAVREGSTIVRVGSKIFGERNINNN